VSILACSSCIPPGCFPQHAPRRIDAVGDHLSVGVIVGASF
jgi:hypothetical protein